MATWSLHIVGQELESEIEKIGSEIVKLIESHGHTLVSAILGTDNNTTSIDTNPPADTFPADDDTVPTDTPPTSSPTGDTTINNPVDQSAVVPGDSAEPSAPTA